MKNKPMTQTRFMFVLVLELFWFFVFFVFEQKFWNSNTLHATAKIRNVFQHVDRKKGTISWNTKPMTQTRFMFLSVLEFSDFLFFFVFEHKFWNSNTLHATAKIRNVFQHVDRKKTPFRETQNPCPKHASCFCFRGAPVVGVGIFFDKLWRVCWSRSTMHTCVGHVEQYCSSEEVMKEGFIWTASACVNIDNRPHFCFHRFVAMLTCDLVLLFLCILCFWFLWILNFCFNLLLFVPLVFVVMSMSFFSHVFCTCRSVCFFFFLIMCRGCCLLMSIISFDKLW